ncbi:MAG: toxin-antitoxin system HicB family antitoxin [Verrucomicrobiota bacterium]
MNKRTARKRKSDRYLKVVEWSERDRCYVGTSPGFFAGGVHGADPQQVFAELGEVIDEWIDILEKDGKELPPATAGNYSGKFVLRIAPELHKLLAIRSHQSGDSLNQYCAKVLAEAAKR